MTTPLNNIASLNAERLRLKYALHQTKYAIQDDFLGIQENLSPLKIGIGIAKSMFSNNQHGIVSLGVGTIIEKLIKSPILHFLPAPLRFVSSFLLKNFASNYVVNHKEMISKRAVGFLSIMKYIFARKSKDSNVLKVV
ncbi:MAG: hypothetical protein ACKVOU_06255 [Cytophagales bacterium]